MRSHRNLAAFAAFLAVAFFVTWKILPSHEPDMPRPPDDGMVPDVSAVPSEQGSRTAGPSNAAEPAEEGDLHSYAVPLSELPGLSPEASPGTRLELWVAWEPPLTRKPQVRRLLGNVVLDGIVPPVTPQGPMTALLLVREDQTADLVYGDRYGSLSAVAFDPG